MRVAVLGMGQMGQSLTRRMLDGGHEVWIWNRTPGRAGGLIARGAVESATASAAAAHVEVVFSSLTDDVAVRAVLTPDDRPLTGIDAEGAVVDCSTVSPHTSRFVSAAYDGRFVAAPIMGSPAALASGNAAMVLGGPKDLLDHLDPLWSAVSEHIIRCGDDVGLASIVKLINNYLLLSGIATLGEVVATAQQAGLEDGFLTDLLSSSPLVPLGLHNRITRVVERRHDGWFSTPLGAKDVGLFVDVARSVDLELPVAEAVRNRYHLAAERGLADADIAAIVDLYPQKR